MSNPFSSRALPLSGPATDAMPVTPSDATDLADTAVAPYQTGLLRSIVAYPAGTL